MAQDLSAKKQNFCIRVVNACQQLQANRNTLKGLIDEWNANGFGSGATSISQNDIAGGGINHLTPTILAAVFTSQANLETYMTSGNATNICAAIAN